MPYPRPVEPSVRYIKEGHPPGLKRFEQTMEISGIWDSGSLPAGLFSEQQPRDLTVTPLGFRLGPLFLWPYRYTTTAVVNHVTTSVDAENLTTVAASFTPTSATVCERAAWWRWLLFWAGWPVVRVWRSWRATE